MGKNWTSRGGAWVAALVTLALMGCDGDPDPTSDAGGGMDAGRDAGPPPTPLEALRGAAQGPAEVQTSFGRARNVRGTFETSGGAAEDAAREFLEAHADAFGIDEATELSLREVREDALSRVVIFNARHDGRPIFGGEVRAGFEPDGALVYVGARLPGPVDVPTDATIPLTDAAAAAVSALAGEGPTGLMPLGTPALGVFSPALWAHEGGPAVLAYRARLVDYAGHVAIVYVDATDGSRLGWAMETRAARDRFVGECDAGVTFDACSDGSHRELATEAGPVVDDTDPRFADAEALHGLLGMAYDYFQSVHGRDSFDDEGSPVRAFYSDHTQENAWWQNDHLAMEISDLRFVARDVILHELTHAITDHETTVQIEVRGGGGETQPIWVQPFGEPGALTESLGDVFAALSSGDWQQETATAVDRDLTNPANPHVDEISAPNAIYSNSGVPSMAMYLLSEGGPNPGRIGEPAVMGIGASKVEQIVYRAVNLYLDLSTTFVDFRFQTLRACEDLIGRHGIVLQDCGELLVAWASVGVGGWDHDRDLWADECHPSDDECVEVDNCPPDTDDPTAARAFFNPVQEDSDFDGVGDVCEGGDVDAGAGVDAGPMEDICPLLFPGDGGDIALRDQLGPIPVSAWPDQASYVRCTYQEGGPGSDAVGFTLNWVHTPGPARMDGCYTHTPRGDRNHCSETVQAVAGIALLDDGFEDAAERAFLPTLLARIEPLAIACPPLTYDDSPCPTGRIRCPAEFVHADGRVMPLDPFGQTCPWESDPDVFAAVCSFRDQPCDNGLAEPPEPGTYRGTGRPGYSLTWGTTPTAGSFRCTEERVNRFGGTIWSSGTHRASVAFFPDDTISSGIESVALADGRAQAEMRAAMCP